MVHSQWWEVRPIDRYYLVVGDNLANHHVWTVELRQLNIPPLRSLLRYQADPLSRSPVSDDCRLRADNIIPQEIVVVYYVWDIRLHQEHNVLVPFIDGMNPLGGDNAVAVLNIVHPQVEF